MSRLQFYDCRRDGGFRSLVELTSFCFVLGVVDVVCAGSDVLEQFGQRVHVRVGAAGDGSYCLRQGGELLVVEVGVDEVDDEGDGVSSWFWGGWQGVPESIDSGRNPQ